MCMIQDLCCTFLTFVFFISGTTDGLMTNIDGLSSSSNKRHADAWLGLALELGVGGVGLTSRPYG